MNFFRYVANIIVASLKSFQRDKPIVSFLYFDLKAIVSQLLKILVKSSVIKSCKNVRQLKEIDLCGESNLIRQNEFRIFFGSSYPEREEV